MCHSTAGMHIGEKKGKQKTETAFIEAFFHILFPLAFSWFTVTNKRLPLLPALIGLGGVQLRESAALTERTDCWLSLSEHAQTQPRRTVHMHTADNCLCLSLTEHGRTLSEWAVSHSLFCIFYVESTT